ncbi:unannotated protein [freshwater metagenome]|uniref:Unannotated protein n=1 Tax=freshwater metagenome TaxID=449393 RepID=A0A6J7D0Z4_9ZZZZ|nr:hypothetical protein [Actinomycetota bacterium]
MSESGGAPEGKLRGEALAEALRAGLTPLGPNERPLPLRVAAIAAFVLAVLNVLLWALNVAVEGAEPSAATVFIFAAILLADAWGIWARHYIAVIGFQAILAATLIMSALALMVASNLWALLLCAVVLGSGGWLFWKLVRVMGRMKAPTSVDPPEGDPNA